MIVEHCIFFINDVKSCNVYEHSKYWDFCVLHVVTVVKFVFVFVLVYCNIQVWYFKPDFSLEWKKYKR